MSIFDTSLLELASKAHGSVWGDIQGYRDSYQKHLTARGPGPGDALMSNIGAGIGMALPGMLGGLFGGGSSPVGPAGWAQTQSGGNIYGSSGLPMSQFDRLVGGAGGWTLGGHLNQMAQN